MNLDLVQRVLAALEANSVDYKIFGGVALNLHGLARATEDLDLFVAPNAQNIDRLRAALKQVFADPSVDEITAEDLLGEYPAVQYNPPDGGFHVDILTRLGELYRFDELESERVPLGDLIVSVISPRTLFRMKKDTVRLKDRADAALLAERFDLEV
jgi:hypothetical protein